MFVASVYFPMGAFFESDRPSIYLNRPGVVSKHSADRESCSEAGVPLRLGDPEGLAATCYQADERLARLGTEGLLFSL